MWKTRPIFVSSTFVDMQYERDYLLTRVFPELEEKLSGRRHHLEWVDLRLGVAVASLEQEAQRELHVLKVCLAEVRRCRPFLIVLLGHRYGWVPPPQRMQAATTEEGFAGELTGRSVTDLEIDFGVLSDPEQQARSFFYFREPLDFASMPAEIAALYSDGCAKDAEAGARAAALEALKQRIIRELPGRVRRYTATWDNERKCLTGLEAWAGMVRDDIWAELDKETAAAVLEQDAPWQQAERNALQDFAEECPQRGMPRRASDARQTRCGDRLGSAGNF